MAPFYSDAHDDSTVTDAESDAAFDVGFNVYNNYYVLADNPHTNYFLKYQFVEGWYGAESVSQLGWLPTGERDCAY